MSGIPAQNFGCETFFQQRYAGERQHKFKAAA
jgi:hypothetical protein